MKVLIIGGGLAGLINAIHLSKEGIEVTLVEKNSYPKHKVCGEYISNEVLPYLNYLDIDPFALGATKIDQFLLSTAKGKSVTAKLPLGGFGISRYTLDYYLYQKALAKGCRFIQAKAEKIEYQTNKFTVHLNNGTHLSSEFLIGAFGKRSNIDYALNRSFVQKKAPFLGVKCHYEGDFPDDLVALYNFKGGYCGVSKVENGRINICYIASYEAFKRYRNLSVFEEQVLFKNPQLATIFTRVQPVFKAPISISQISFLPKKQVNNHIFMSGDAAGMIHPLCGNGMGMAIGSAQILSSLLIDYDRAKVMDRESLAQKYQQIWLKQFGKRLMAGRLFNYVFSQDLLFANIMKGLLLFPTSIPFFIKQTHGQAIPIS